LILGISHSIILLLDRIKDYIMDIDGKKVHELDCK